MPFRNYPILLVIFILAIITVIKSEIPNCLFVNTVNLTNTNTNNIYFDSYNTAFKIEPHLLADYDFKVLKDGSKVNVTKHKRGCLCLNPCLSMCSQDPITLYYENDEMLPSYQRDVTLQNGNETEQDFIKFFNHRFPNMTCEKVYPLTMELVEADKWSIFENGTLLIYNSNEYLNHDEYCFDLYTFPENKLYQGSIISPYVCAAANKPNTLDSLKNWAMLCSVPFFMLTIFVYCFLPEFRNCHGKCFVMYLLHLTVTYSLICYNTLLSQEVDEVLCITIGYVIYFGTISFLTWISIISYDTYISLTDLDCTTLFRRYFKWAIIIPGVATFVLFLIQSLEIDEHYKPGIEADSCGVKATRWSATFYYYIPHIIVLVFSLTLYIKLIRFLVQNERDATSFANRLKASYMKRFSLYLRLFIFMGIVWFLEVMSYFIDMLKGQNIITFITDLCNALHGLFIFFSIIFNSRIYRYIRKRFLPARYAEHELITLTSGTSS